MNQWEKDIAITLRYVNPHYRTALRLMEFRDVDDFGIDHHECEGDEYGLHWFPVYSGPRERLIMRAKGFDLEQAERYVMQHRAQEDVERT